MKTQKFAVVPTAGMHSSGDSVHDRLAADQKSIEQALGEFLCTDSNPCGAMVDAEPGGQWRITDDWHTEVYCDTAAAVAAAKTWGG